MNKLFDSYLAMLKSIQSIDDVTVTDNVVGVYEDMNFTCEWAMCGVGFMYWISPEYPDSLAAVRNVNDTSENREMYLNMVLKLSLDKFDSDIKTVNTTYGEYTDEGDVYLTDEQVHLIAREVSRIKENVLK